MSTTGDERIGDNIDNGSNLNELEMTGAVEFASYQPTEVFSNTNENGVEIAYQADLNAMGIEVEAEEDLKEATVPPKPSNVKSSKKSSSSKEPKLCEQLLDIKSANPGQLAAIKRIATKKGLEQIKKWIEQAKKDKDSKRMPNLLAQLYHADVNMDDMRDLELGLLIGELARQGFDKDVKQCAIEIKQQWSGMLGMQESLKKSQKPTSKKDEDIKPKTKAVPPTSSSSFGSSLSGQSGGAKVEEKKASKPRPKTVRTPKEKFRSTGLEEDDVDTDSVKRQPSGLSIPPRPVPLLRPPAPKPTATVSNAFSQSLSGPSTFPVIRPVVRKRPEPVQLSDPSVPAKRPAPELVTTPTSSAIAALESSQRHDMDGGPNAERVPPADVPKNKRRIHFADDKEQQLVFIQFIEPRTNADKEPRNMKGTDMEHEKKILDHNRLLTFDDETDTAECDAPYKLTPYMPFDVKEFFPALIEDENTRLENSLLGFYLPDVPSAPPGEEDPSPFTYTQPPDPTGITQIALEVPAEVIAANEAAQRENVESPASPGELQILPDVDIHAAQRNPAPEPVSELVILDEDPSHLAKPKQKNAEIRIDDIKSILQKVKNKSAAPILTSIPPPGLVNPSHIGFLPLPTKSASAEQMFPATPTQTMPPTAAGDLVELTMDIHSSGMPHGMSMMHQPPRPFAPRMPHRNPNHRPPQSSGFPCKFFAQGTCTFGDNCFNMHTPGGGGPGMHQMNRFARPPMGVRMPRFNHPPPSMGGFGGSSGGFGSSTGTPPQAQQQPPPAARPSVDEEEQEYRSSFATSSNSRERERDRDRDRGDRQRGDRDGRRYAPSSPKRRNYRSRSRSRSRSFSPEYHRRRRQSPPSRKRYRSRSRSPIRSRSRSLSASR